MTAIPREELVRRRVLAAEAIGDGVLVLGAGTPVRYSRDIEHRFRADADFLYLAGWGEPGAVLVYRPRHANPLTLFVHPRDPQQEAWTGPRPGPEGALELCGADAAFPRAELDERIADLIDGAQPLFYAPWGDPSVDASVRRALETLRSREATGRSAPDAMVHHGAVLHELRLVKSAFELERLERAAAATVDGVRAGLARLAPGVREFEVQAAVESTFRAAGGTTGFDTIVAAGRSACVLHYTANRGTLGEMDLVLIDAGAELDEYNGDVSRTAPASGRFAPAQRALYEAVLQVQETLIAAIRPGATMGDIRRLNATALTEALTGLGVLHGSPAALLESGAQKPYTLHGPSHFIGLDVHDVGRHHVNRVSRALVPGMVLTVEPGLYFPADDPAVPAELRGQAVRIEDDVVVTNDGCRALTRALPVAPDAIEELVGANAR